MRLGRGSVLGHLLRRFLLFGRQKRQRIVQMRRGRFRFGGFRRCLGLGGGLLLAGLRRRLLRMSLGQLGGLRLLRFLSLTGLLGGLLALAGTAGAVDVAA